LQSGNLRQKAAIRDIRKYLLWVIVPVRKKTDVEGRRVGKEGNVLVDGCGKGLKPEGCKNGGGETINKGKRGSASVRFFGGPGTRGEEKTRGSTRGESGGPRTREGVSRRQHNKWRGVFRMGNTLRRVHARQGGKWGKDVKGFVR